MSRCLSLRPSLFLSAIAAVFLSASASFAGIEPGVYSGLNEAGSICTMTVGETYFENNVPHPLNERIKIEIDGLALLVRHPSVINVAESVAGFDHDHFEAIVPTPTGAKAFVIDMSHVAGSEGPLRFTSIENFWREGRKVKVTCDRLTRP